MGGTGRAAGGTGIKESENKGHIVCWNKGNKRAWLELSDCLCLKTVGKCTGPVGGTALRVV